MLLALLLGPVCSCARLPASIVDLFRFTLAKVSTHVEWNPKPNSYHHLTGRLVAIYHQFVTGDPSPLSNSGGDGSHQSLKPECLAKQPAH